MFVLDTDVVSVLQQEGGEEYTRLAACVGEHDEGVYATVVSIDEQFRGWTALANRRNTPEHYSYATSRLARMLEFYRGRRILPFDDRAGARFRLLKAAKVRISTMDLRIAAIALANNATLVTRNLSDFRRVPGLRAEDWTRPA